MLAEQRAGLWAVKMVACLADCWGAARAVQRAGLSVAEKAGQWVAWKVSERAGLSAVCWAGAKAAPLVAARAALWVVHWVVLSATNWADHSVDLMALTKAVLKET